MRISDWSSDVCSSDLFADGFADTAQVVATLGEPGRVDPGAGQRYIQIPVGITATTSDGSVRRYAGTYTLHRTVVDGATAEQRAWRIASARSEEHTSELQSLMRISYAVFCLKKKNKKNTDETESTDKKDITR